MNNYDYSNRYSSIASAAVKQGMPARKHQPGTLSALYKLAARNLRESHGVPSMTALKLEKTVALLRLAPRRVVKQGLAPRKLLKGETSELVDTDADNLANISSTEEEKGVSDDSDSKHDDKTEDSGEARRPIHAALVAGGIHLRPNETRPLLRALGVKPHRLVRLGLVKREALRAMPGGRENGRGQHRRLRAGGPRQGGAGRPHGPPHGPPRDHGGQAMPSPPRRPFHGDGHDAVHLGRESEGEGVSAPLGPHGVHGHRGPRHQGGRPQGPPHGPGQHGRHGGGKHGHGHRHPPHGHGHGHGHSEGEGEEGKRLHGETSGPGQRGRRRLGGGMGTRSHGPPHGPPRGPFQEEGASARRHEAAWWQARRQGGLRRRWRRRRRVRSPAARAGGASGPLRRPSAAADGGQLSEACSQDSRPSFPVFTFCFVVVA
ncbi:unnamed protein product [Laminaria digitata]